MGLGDGEILVTGLPSENETDDLIVENTARNWSNVTLDLFLHGPPKTEKVDLLEVPNINEHVVMGGWVWRSQNLVNERARLEAAPFQAALMSLVPEHHCVRVKTGAYVEHVDWAREVIRAIESKIPVVILAIPFLAFFIAWVLMRASKPVRKYVGHRHCQIETSA